MECPRSAKLLESRRQYLARDATGETTAGSDNPLARDQTPSPSPRENPALPPSPWAHPYPEIQARPPVSSASWFQTINRVALFGGVSIFAGGLLFATAEFSYADLGGAASLDSFRWIWQLLGLAYLFVGLGIFLGLAGLESGLPTWGGGIAF